MALEHEDLLRQFEDVAKAESAGAVMERMAHLLHEKLTRYNWVGFYMVDPKAPDILQVGAYVGSFTPNARIPLSSGLCGAAASTGQTVVVDDVRKDPRYLAGSSLVVSEIVVPIFARGKLAGELDVESYFPAAFPKGEQEFLEACARLVGQCLEKAT